VSKTQTSSLLTDQVAFDRIAYFALRSELLFDAVADVMPVAQAMPGSSVKFTIFNDLAPASSTLTEDTDVTPVAMSDSQVEVTLAEYGNAVNTTAKLRGTSFLDVDAAAANIVGYNAGISVDGVIRDVLSAGTNVIYGGGGASTPAARIDLAVDDIITANDIRKIVAALRSANTVSFNGMYMSFIHPDVSYDLRRETGVASWRDPHVYVDVAGIYNGEVGAFEGVRFIETPRAKIFENAFNGTGGCRNRRCVLHAHRWPSGFGQGSLHRGRQWSVPTCCARSSGRRTQPLPACRLVLAWWLRTLP
jgi:N4-gp56 family major capsid protein